MKKISVSLCLALIFVFGMEPRPSAAALADTIEQIKPAVVGVGTFQPTRRPRSKLLGTGFAVSGRYVLTNYHVAGVDLDKENREHLIVFVGTGAKPKRLKAKLVKSDKVHDLAVLEVDFPIPSVRLSDTRVQREGTEVAFTGFPIGAVLGLYPVTHRGLISSVTPIAIPSSASKLLSANKIKRLRNPTLVYQLDATAYPGNSGSPLFLPETGEVIGILNMVHVKTTKEDVLSKPSGISFAIPIKHAVELIRSLP
ncbi:serine protease [Motiliproteus sp. MSK22-1]|uniref:S1 family peptidase n=1 Tax=Motiliproteus sp. MSK22-1 TaxID=1897630 RepID=UPI0009785C69|nr:serine protease [Motiliproteus sp. MSK22-1]OMH25661.1 peptidase S1 [Motiliproteus sp. MSK22-1]